jgi:hypothetical protein
VREHRAVRGDTGDPEDAEDSPSKGAGGASSAWRSAELSIQASDRRNALQPS